MSADISELKEEVLLEDLSDEMLQVIAGGLEELTFRKDDPVFKEGQDTRGVYIVRSGKIEISKKTEDGWKQRLAVLSERDFFGELSIMEKRNHEADAMAVEDSKLFLIPKAFFESIEKENLELALALMKKIAMVMGKNLRTMNDRFIKALINY